MDIKARRNELGLTLEDIAKCTGVTKATVSRWESGDIATMKTDKVLALARTLKVTPLDIIGTSDLTKEEKDNEEMTEYLQAIHDRPELKILFQKGKNATPEQLNAILALLGK